MVNQGKIWIGNDTEGERVYLSPGMANRHGLIAALNLLKNVEGGGISKPSSIFFSSLINLIIDSSSKAF